MLESELHLVENYMGSITNIGKKKKENQDSVLVTQLPSNGLDLMIVCDGVSTSPYSRESADFACAYIEKELNKPNVFNRDYIRSVLIDLNHEIYKKQEKINDHQAFLTTIVLSVIKQISDNEYLTFIFSSGDSRAYLYSYPDTCSILTEDHSYVRFLYNRGDIELEEMDAHPKKNIITNCLGVDPKIFSINSVSCKFSNKDILLLCSDGLYGYSDIVKRFPYNRNLKDMLHSLIDKVISQSKASDNISVAIFSKKD